jgi:hypothetical protein
MNESLRLRFRLNHGLLLAFAILPAPILMAQSSRSVPIVEVHPEIITEPIPNPYMGYGIWAGRRGFGNNEQDYSVADCTTGFGDDAPLFNWVLIDWDWASLEPKEGEYQWKDFDAVAQYWSKRGKQIIVRFWVTDDSGWNGRRGADVLPQWLWDKGLKSHEYVGNGGRKTTEPDYADSSYTAVYLPALQSFLTAFAARYDTPGTPFTFIQAMGYGHWADYATWYSKYQFPTVEAKHDTLARLLGLYINTFHNIQVMEMAAGDWDSEKYPTLNKMLYSQALDVATANGFALIWTGFIDGLNKTHDRELMDRFWRGHPIIAEGNWNYTDMEDQHTHGTLKENIDGAVDWHANFFHLYFEPATYKRAIGQDRKGLEFGLMAGGIGYRLVPSSLSWPEELPAGHLLVLHQQWINQNAGRLYVAHPLKLYLTDASGKEVFSLVNRGLNETDWIQGQTYKVMSAFQLAKSIPPGTYDLKIALVDQSGKPTIRLGIVGGDSDLRYRIGQIKILPSDASGGCDSSYCP